MLILKVSIFGVLGSKGKEGFVAQTFGIWASLGDSDVGVSGLFQSMAVRALVCRICTSGRRSRRCASSLFVMQHWVGSYLLVWVAIEELEPKSLPLISVYCK